jgi:hypothetical protein
MEEKIFPLPAVAAQLQNFVEARLHTDQAKNVEENRSLQQKLTQSVANPYYVIVDPKTERVLGRFDHATLGDPEPFIRFLQDAKAF